VPIDYISGNISSFSSISYPKFLILLRLSTDPKWHLKELAKFLYLLQLTRSLNSYVTFTVNSIVIQQQHSMSHLIIKGHWSRDLYHLKSSLSVSCFAISDPKLLNNTLGHQSLSKLKMVISSFKHIQALDCESCRLRKYVTSSFPKKFETRCNSVFTNIHYDIWRPSRVTSFDLHICNLR